MGDSGSDTAVRLATPYDTPSSEHGVEREGQSLLAGDGSHSKGADLTTGYPEFDHIDRGSATMATPKAVDSIVATCSLWGTRNARR